MSDPIVGIDLGTSNSVVAHADAAGHVKVLADDGGYKIHPSVVSFHPNGGVVVGAGAKQRKVIDPQNTIYSVKRLIGRAYESAEVQIAKRRVPYQIKEGPNRAPLIVTRGGEFAVPEISAIVLDHVRNIGSARLGTQVSRAVVTVPASFNDAQRSATATAGAIAGLTVVRVLNEPTAAALAYGHSRNLRQTIAVYDFGGGTFDITLLKLDDQVYEVLGTAGDTFLGGDDLDERLVDKMVAKFLAENRIDLRTNEVSMMRLRAVAEQTKIELSRRSRAVVRIDEIAYGPRGVPLNLQIEISRDEFVHEVADIIDRTFPVCQEALTIAGVGIHQIDDIILVGGTTKIPYVRDQVSKFFTKAPRTDVNPEDAVAIGAALQAVSLERVLSKPRTGRLAAQKQFPEDEDTLNRAAGTTNTSIDLVDTGGQAVVMQPPEVSPPSVPRPKRSTANYDEREVQLPDTSYRVTRGNVRDVVDKANEVRPPTRPPEEESTAPNPPIVIPPASNALPPPPTDDTSYTLTRGGQKDTYTEKAKKDPLAPTSGEITRPGAPVPNLDDMLAPKGAFEEMGLAPVSAKQEMGLAPKAIGRMSRPVATPPPLPTAPAGPQGKQTLFGVPPGPDPKRPAPQKPGEVGNTTDVIRSLQADQTTTHGPRPTPPADSQPTLPRHAPPRAFTDSDDFTDEGQAFRTPLPSGLTPLPSTTAPMSPVAPIAPATAPTLVALAPDFAAEVDSVTAASTNKLLEQQAAASTAKGMGPVNTLNLPPPTGMHPATTAKGFPPPQAQPPDPHLAPPLRPAPPPVAQQPPPSPFIPQQPPPRLPPAPLPLAPPPPVPMAPPNAQTLYVPPAPSTVPTPAAPPFQALPAPAPLPLLDLPGWPAQPPGWEQSSVQPPPPVQGQRPAPVLLEVTPRGLGIATVAGYCEELIRRNSRLPTEMKKLFTTSRDRQDIVRIVVCQGESRRMDKNVVIGDLVLQGLPPRPRGETSIEVTFFVDASGVLQVSARDALTGNEQRASLDLVGGMQDVAASRERIQRLRSDAS